MLAISPRPLIAIFYPIVVDAIRVHSVVECRRGEILTRSDFLKRYCARRV